MPYALNGSNRNRRKEEVCDMYFEIFYAISVSVDKTLEL
jgi:hypothetical protein